MRKVYVFSFVCWIEISLRLFKKPQSTKLKSFSEFCLIVFKLVWINEVSNDKVRLYTASQIDFGSLVWLSLVSNQTEAFQAEPSWANSNPTKPNQTERIQSDSNQIELFKARPLNHFQTNLNHIKLNIKPF